MPVIDMADSDWHIVNLGDKRTKVFWQGHDVSAFVTGVTWEALPGKLPRACVSVIAKFECVVGPKEVPDGPA